MQMVVVPLKFYYYGIIIKFHHGIFISIECVLPIVSPQQLAKFFKIHLFNKGRVPSGQVLNVVMPRILHQLQFFKFLWTQACTSIICNFLSSWKEVLTWDRRHRDWQDIESNASKGGIKLVVILFIWWDVRYYQKWRNLHTCHHNIISISGVTSAGISLRYCYSSASHPSFSFVARRVRWYWWKSDKTKVVSMLPVVEVVGVVVSGAHGQFFQYFSIYNLSVNRNRGRQYIYLCFYNLSCFILPVFCMSITFCSFFSLLFRSAPCEFDVCEFIAWMKNCSQYH